MFKKTFLLGLVFVQPQIAKQNEKNHYKMAIPMYFINGRYIDKYLKEED